ncbi:hypothetical protein GCM10009827_109530 [Dactylosporangium maewongense]|uniref:Integrase catalytic domain-containing protein n=1 Tax=Dactylosporangium maewongense TaxID=634393 RepID=A0ABN2D413_9ACTN
MASKPVAFLLADLGVTKSHSRPHTSNDNPFSESQFRTLKYRPEFPATFANLLDARAFCQRFFGWYNTEHRPVSPGTPRTTSIMDTPGRFMRSARRCWTPPTSATLERFVRKHPEPAVLPTAAWINKPAE